MCACAVDSPPPVCAMTDATFCAAPSERGEEKGGRAPDCSIADATSCCLPSEGEEREGGAPEPDCSGAKESKDEPEPGSESCASCGCCAAIALGIACFALSLAAFALSLAAFSFVLRAITLGRSLIHAAFSDP